MKSTMNKMLTTYVISENRNMLVNTMLQHSVFAKNALLHQKGFSPLMRVYGRSPSVVPSMEEDHIAITDPMVAERVEIMR